MSEATVRIVVGANWGDEGKGRMVDYFAQRADIVGRYQGGNNAGHTVVNEYGEFKLHLLPSGVFNPETLNVLGSGMVIDLAGLAIELDELAKQGIHPKLLISDRATLALPLHRLEDELEEARLGDQAFGSTKNGIAYAYADRYAKKAIQLGMLKQPDVLKKYLKRWYDWKIPMLTGLYGEQPWPALDEILQPLLSLAERFAPIIGDVQQAQLASQAKSIVLEAQLGTLRDLTVGNYPFTTSSSVLAANAELGSGLHWTAKPTVTAVVKAFSSSVGEGPFPTAMDDMSELRETAHEFGARTGRARDVGHFDAVATQYGVKHQKTDEVALTKLDCLSGQPQLQICTAYELEGQRLDNYPLTGALYEVTPVYEQLPGWQEDIGNVRDFADLPENAQRYVERIEALIGCRIRYVSVGPHREQLILR